jgi:hypothetical protein
MFGLSAAECWWAAPASASTVTLLACAATSLPSVQLTALAVKAEMIAMATGGVTTDAWVGTGGVVAAGGPATVGSGAACVGAAEVAPLWTRRQTEAGPSKQGRQRPDRRAREVARSTARQDG